jgi:hypothetical protein
VQFFRVERHRGRFRWRFRLGRIVVSNSLLQYSVRECKANIQKVVFWSTRRVLESSEENRYILLARGHRESTMLLVPYLGGWNWRLKDERRVYFQPDVDEGRDDPLDAFVFFDSVRAAFLKLPPKATRRVVVPCRK